MIFLKNLSIRKIFRERTAEALKLSKPAVPHSHQSPSSAHSSPFLPSKASTGPTLLGRSSSTEPSPPTPAHRRHRQVLHRLSLRPATAPLPHPPQRQRLSFFHLPLPPPPPAPKSKSTWVNPSKPKPSARSPHRRRSPPLSTPTLNISPSSPAALSEAFPTPFLPRKRRIRPLTPSVRGPKRSNSSTGLSTATTASFPADTPILYHEVATRRPAARPRLAHRPCSTASPTPPSSPPPGGAAGSTGPSSGSRGFTGPVSSPMRSHTRPSSCAQLGKREEAVSLYERAWARGWTPDPVAFSVLGK